MHHLVFVHVKIQNEMRVKPILSHCVYCTLEKNFPFAVFVLISDKPPLLIPSFIPVFPTATFIPETIKQSIYFAEGGIDEGEGNCC